GSSKAAAELAVDAYRALYAAKHIGLASARAGNVIGGGDWSADRLVPDLVRALWSGEPALLRNPAAIRPWHCGFDPLPGYPAYPARRAGAPPHFPPPLTSPPPEPSPRPVIDVADRFVARFNDHPRWQSAGAPKFHEAAILRLSAAKAA